MMTLMELSRDAEERQVGSIRIVVLRNFWVSCPLTVNSMLDIRHVAHEAKSVTRPNSSHRAYVRPSAKWLMRPQLP